MMLLSAAIFIISASQRTQSCRIELAMRDTKYGSTNQSNQLPSSNQILDVIKKNLQECTMRYNRQFLVDTRDFSELIPLYMVFLSQNCDSLRTLQNITFDQLETVIL
ncbi:Hypothetical_protein [Hexamita inflata]|uniref:Hypothetical_protein n=1 Tax=Hexamita inflata TaxID=28002 RepID=A0ABP1JVE8_9EUKA